MGYIYQVQESGNKSLSMFLVGVTVRTLTIFSNPCLAATTLRC